MVTELYIVEKWERVVIRKYAQQLGTATTEFADE